MSVFLSIHLSVDIWVVSMSWLLGIMPHIQWKCRSLFEMVISFHQIHTQKWGLLDHMIVLFLTFWGIPVLFSIVADHFTFPPTVPKCSLLSVSSPKLVTCCLSDNSRSGWQLYVIFEKMSVKILHTTILTYFLPIFISVLCVFI